MIITSLFYLCSLHLLSNEGPALSSPDSIGQLARLGHGVAIHRPLDERQDHTRQRRRIIASCPEEEDDDSPDCEVLDFTVIARSPFGDPGRSGLLAYRGPLAS